MNVKFNFVGDLSEIKTGLEILKGRLGFEIAEDGYTVNITKVGEGLKVSGNESEAEIRYSEKIHFFRALGLLTEHFGENFSIFENPVFKENGIMIDASRNAVMMVESIKDFIEIMAVMGLNMIMLYTEDTYEVSEYPYFGYMRGKYTCDELSECDRYADIFGIEMIPCIQTLGHLTKVLKWNHGLEIKDTDTVLLVGNDDTYKFIENIITAATKPFKSNRIHIGMDEAEDLGLGAYLKKNGYKKGNKIVKEHLAKVMEITNRLGLKPLIWSDAYFTPLSPTGGYYDVSHETMENEKPTVPENLSIVFWDYYHEDYDTYDNMLKMHKMLNAKTFFAGGIWKWGRMTVNYRKTFKSMIPALNACKENGIDSVFATMWGDDGNSVNIYEILYGMQLFAEIGYGYSENTEHLNKRFRTCIGENGEAFLQLDMLDDFGQTENLEANPSDYLLWQDILMGVFDKHIEGVDTVEFYRNVKEKMKENYENSIRYKGIFLYSMHLADVLEIKAGLGVALKNFYDNGDKDGLLKICNEVLPELKMRVVSFKNIFRELWLSTYKPFGFESVDMKIGTLLSRIETTKYRIEQYLTGKIEKIDELEQERLYYWKYGDEKYTDLNVYENRYIKYVNVAYSSNGISD